MAIESTAPEWAPEDAGSRRTLVAAGCCVLWLWLYMADFHVSPTLPVFALAAPVLVLLTLSSFRRFGRAVTWLAAVLLANFVYQKIINTEDSLRPVFALAMLVYFFSLAPLRTERGLKVVATGFGLFFIASFALFLLTLCSEEARALRSSIYVHVEDAMVAEFGAGQSRNIRFSQGGLTGLLFVFGYQVASGLVFLLGLAGLSRGVRRGLWIAGFLVSCGALVLMGERSALVACGLGVLALLWVTRRWGHTVLIVLLILLAAWVFMVHLERVEQITEFNVFTRMMSEDDTMDRMRLQAWALRKALQYPMGLMLAGVDYWDVLARERPEFWASPHNGYITRLLNFGWVVGICTLIVFVRLVRMWTASFRAHGPGMLSGLELTALAALVGVMANALFHNQSFVTFNPDTLAMMFFYAACFDARRAAESGEEEAELEAQAEAAEPETEGPSE